MASRKRSKYQRQADLEFISSLIIRGTTVHDEIMQQLNACREYKLSRQQVTYDIEAIECAWRSTTIVNYNYLMAKELMRLDVVEKSAWAAWTSSRSQREQVVEVNDDFSGASQAFTRHKTTRTTEGRDGDVRYLEIVTRCVELRCKILGLNSPRRFEVSWRVEAVKAGLDPNKIYTQMVKGFLEPGEDDD